MFLYFLAGHFFADFVFQSHKVASNKGKSYAVLAHHVGIYTVVMTGVFMVCNSPTNFKEPMLSLFGFTVLTAATHALTDAITSRISSKLFAGALDDFKQNGYTGEKFGSHMHDFFVVVGLDQFIHAATLYWTLHILKVI